MDGMNMRKDNGGNVGCVSTVMEIMSWE